MKYLYKWYDDDEVREYGRVFGKTPEPEVLGHFPTWIRKGGPRLVHAERANRFLRHQTKRILRLIEEGRYEGAVLIWMLLLRSSISYQLVLFHRAFKGWYWKNSGSDVRMKFVRCAEQLRRWEIKFEMLRYYIKKPNGKFRPIGAPDLCSKMIGKALNDITVFLFREEVHDTHHGFLPQRGVHTAILNIMCNYYEKGWTHIYEFDLRSWFNMVNPSWVRERISEKSEYLANEIYKVTHETFYKWPQGIKPEAELKIHKNVFKNLQWKPLIERSGMPQGSPLSPILSTLALSYFTPPKGLVMYADDGVIMSDVQVGSDYLNQIGKVGAEIAPEKSRIVDNGWLKFLGLWIDFPGKSVFYKTSVFRFTKWDKWTAIGLLDWLIKQRIHYTSTDADVGWYWKVHKQAYIRSQKKPRLNIVERIKIIWRSIIHALPWKGYRLMSWRIYDVPNGSSFALNELIKDLRTKKLCPKKPFKWVRDYSEEIRDKGTYCEYLSEEEGISRMGIGITQEYLAEFMRS